MKTIQEVLKYMNTDEIIDYYLSKYMYISLNTVNTRIDSLTLSEYRNMIKKNLKDMIDRLVKMTPNHSTNKCILFVYKCVGNDTFDDIDVGLIEVDELLNADDISNVNTYDYVYERQEDTINYLVADTTLAQTNLLDLVTSYLYDMSFFGYEQGHLEEERQKLDNASKELEEHSEKLTARSIIDINDGYEDALDDKYPEEEEKLSVYYKSMFEYNKYCKAEELKKIKKDVLADKSYRN